MIYFLTIIILVIVLIYYIKYKANIITLNKLFSSIAFKSIVIIIEIVFLFVIGIFNFKNVRKNYVNKYEELYSKTDRLIKDETHNYNFYMRKKYDNQKYNLPYIPEEFTYVEGEWNTGYVIQDTAGNQFVWVPCTNNNIDEVTKLQRKDFTQNAFIKYYECNNLSYLDFIKSAIENGGFYISRYEIGNENGKTVSKKNFKIMSNINQTEAIELSKNMYKTNSSINSELINGYAYDTTLEWIQNTNKIQKYVRTSNDDLTGKNSYNNIYDFTDNVLELTTEMNYDTIIIRGFSANDLEELDYSWSDESRYSIIPESKELTNSKDIMTFRVILYK